MISNNNKFFGLAELKNANFLADKLRSYKELAIQRNLPGPYEAFIEEMSLNQSSISEEEIVEKHHILPRHAGGTDDEINLISLTIPNHILAHWLLWQQNTSENDRIAYLFRVSTTEEREALKRELVMKNVEKYKQEGLFFYNSEFQREQGLKGGKKGGSAGTEAQFKARQKVGSTFGRIVGESNQATETKEFVAKYSIWEFNGYVDQNGVYYAKASSDSLSLESVKQYVVVSPKTSFFSVVETLYQFAPGSINLKAAKKGSMNKLVKKERPQMYGWKIIDTLTRSEVGQGALAQLDYAEQLILETFLIE